MSPLLFIHFKPWQLKKISLQVFSIGIFLFFLGGINLQAQDLHFSQFANSPLHLNPALTGGFDGDFRFNSAYRNQWPTLVEYQTITGSADMNFCTTCNDYGPYSLGALFTYDVAGLSRLSLTQLSLSGAIRRPLFKKHEASLGLMLGVGSRSFDTEDLLSNARLTNTGFDPFFSDNLGNTSNTFFDVSLGINTKWKGNNPRTHLNAGVGLYHINRYNASFVPGNTERQAMRTNIYGLGSLKLTNNLDLLGQGLLTMISNQEEWIFGGGLRIYASQTNNFWKDFSFQVMGSYRIDDALIPSVGLFYRAWFVGYSHDFTTSPLEVANDGNGGPEITLSYIFKRIKVPTSKICPIQL